MACPVRCTCGLRYQLSPGLESAYWRNEVPDQILHALGLMQFPLEKPECSGRHAPTSPTHCKCRCDLMSHNLGGKVIRAWDPWSIRSVFLPMHEFVSWR